MKRTTGFKQYAEMKAKHPDVLLLFRVGNFYEAYRDDARTTSEILGITLTRRRNDGESYYMAGFPRQALETYLPKLIRAGQRVAICDGEEAPNKPTGRSVTDLGEPTPQPDKYGQLSLFSNL